MQETWTEEEVDTLKDLYPTHTAQELSDILGRTKDSIYSKASSLDIKTESKKYPSRRINDRERICDGCGKEYEYNGQGHTKDECRKCYENRRRKERKHKLVSEVFNGECERCGYSSCLSALVFHHRNAEDKSFQISSDGLLKKWEDLVEEARKCNLLCSNCHNEIHCTRCDRKT